MREDIGKMEEQLRQMDDNTRMLLDWEVTLTSSHAIPDADTANYVINSITRCVHRILVKTGEPLFWCTACGWEYGLTRHELAFTTPANHKDLCARCFPELRLRRKRISGVV